MSGSREARSRWIVGPSRPDEPGSGLRRDGSGKPRLYCFPHSGGSTGEYLRWADALSGVGVYGVNLPGRGARFDEQPLLSMTELVAALLNETEFVEPFVVFGHSLGALVAYEVARELRARGRERPDRLLLSAYPPPHLPRRGVPALHQLSDDELLADIDRRYGGVPSPLREDPELVSLVLPAYRADFTVLDAYRHQPAPPLDTPLDVFGGDSDAVSLTQLAEWERHTTREFRLHRFSGGHFYFRDDPTSMTATLSTILRRPSPVRTGGGGP